MKTYNVGMKNIDITEATALDIKFNEKQYVKYQSLHKKLYTRLAFSKNTSDLDMLEKFYCRLLPVTFCDWTD
jgi:hypothetical protein